MPMTIEQAKEALTGSLPEMRAALAYLNQDANLAGLSGDERADAIIARGQLSTLILKTENTQLAEIASGATAQEADLEAATAALNDAVGTIKTTTAILNAATGLLSVVRRIFVLV